MVNWLRTSSGQQVDSRQNKVPTLNLLRKASATEYVVWSLLIIRLWVDRNKKHVQVNKSRWPFQF